MGLPSPHPNPNAAAIARAPRTTMQPRKAAEWKVMDGSALRPAGGPCDWCGARPGGGWPARSAGQRHGSRQGPASPARADRPCSPHEKPAARERAGDVCRKRKEGRQPATGLEPARPAGQSLSRSRLTRFVTRGDGHLSDRGLVGASAGRPHTSASADPFSNSRGCLVEALSRDPLPQGRSFHCHLRQESYCVSCILVAKAY